MSRTRKIPAISTPGAGRTAAPASGLFVTGTDTGVGKTHVACLIVRTLADSGLKVAVMKPVAAGSIDTPAGPRSEDALALMAAANVAAPYATVNPYCLREPVSPHIAAREQGVHIDLAHVGACFHDLAARADCVVVEGAGGWRVPLSDSADIADMAAMLRLPVLLVVGLRLGCLNHALLTQAAVQAQCAFAGWVGNGVDPHFARRAHNLATLEGRLGEPLAVVEHGQTGVLGAATAARLRTVIVHGRRTP